MIWYLLLPALLAGPADETSGTRTPEPAALPLAISAASQPVRHPATRAAPDTARLRGVLEPIAAAHAGVAGIAVRNLATGEFLSIRGDEPFPSASLIKVAVLVTLLDEVEQGRVRLDERISMIARDRVGGSGVLKHMDSGIAPTIADLAWLMIVLSDNTATNLILDRIDVHTVWTKMESLGLPRSKIHSKTFRRETSIAPDSSAVYGLGVTTPAETVRLFALLHEGRAVSPTLDSLALEMLRANQDDAMLTRWLPPGTPVAHKSGMISRARSDCGILYAPAAPVAVCVMTRENEDTSFGVDNAAHRLAGRVAREVFRHYNPEVSLADPPPPG